MILFHTLLTLPPSQIEYRYMTPEMDMMNAFYKDDMFEKMFDETGPWMKMHPSKILRK